MLASLERMEAELGELELRTAPYKESGTYVLGGTDDVQQLLDD